MRPNHLRLVSTSSPPDSFQLETKPRVVGSGPEALWLAFVAARERSQETLALADGLAAGRAYLCRAGHGEARMKRRVPSPTPASLLRAHPGARGFSVSDGRDRLGYVYDDGGRTASKRARAFGPLDECLGEFNSRLVAVAAIGALAKKGPA